MASKVLVTVGFSSVQPSKSCKLIGLCAVLLSVCAGSVSPAACSEQREQPEHNVYQQPAAFLEEVFAGDVPPPQALWITKALQPEVERIMGHGLGLLRVRYWRRDGRTAWILDEIGKDKPITTGIVIGDGRIERTKVLIFRESRGWEVRYPAFVEQFAGIELENGKLNRRIDGITGATLSVRAVSKVANLALYFHRQVTAAEPSSPR